MCKLVQMKSDIYVADIKYDFIENIISQAQKCKGIERIVLFGSSICERCKDDSDIDIAVFGDIDKTTYLKSKEFKEFHRNVFQFKSEEGQDYDILYFVSGQDYEGDIIKEIEGGTTIYRRDVA